MGNLNAFYLMGRVARAPEVTAAPGGGGELVRLAVLPGTGPRAPRGARIEPVVLEAQGSQASVARGLRTGQHVVLRGHLRQERRGEGDGEPTLVARVQAIDLLAPPPRRPREEGEVGAADEGGDGEAAGRRPRRGRRRRGRGRREEGAPGEAPAAAEAAPAGEAGPPARPATESLPPPAPIAPREPVQPPPPDPTYKSDMPF